MWVQITSTTVVFRYKKHQPFPKKKPSMISSGESGFLEGIFAQILLNPKGLLKPKGCRPEGQRAALGVFKIHDWLKEIWRRSSTKNPNLVLIFCSLFLTEP